MPFLADGEIQCCVTSPPYPKQRVYGTDPNEIGQVDSFAEYVEQIVEVGREVRRVLHPTGTWWLNVGHKSTASGGAGGDYDRGGEKAGKPKFGKFRDREYLERQVMDVSMLTGLGLQKDGWRWVTSIVWDKGQGGRERQDENHIRRPALCHELILMLCPTMERQKYHRDDAVEAGSVWHIRPGGRGTGHTAPFPEGIPRRAILLSTDPGDAVLDPFGGEHTTAIVAESLGRRGISLDLYPTPGVF